VIIALASVDSKVLWFARMPIRIFKHYIHLPILLLAVFEFGGFLLSLYTASYLRLEESLASYETTFGPISFRAIIYTLIMSAAMASMGLYQTRQRAGFTGMLARILVSFAIGSIILALVFYIFPGLHLGRGVLALSLLIALVWVGVVRLLFSRVVDQDIFKRRILVYGTGQRALSLTRLRRRADQRGFRIVGYVKAPNGSIDIEPSKIVDLGDYSLIEFARTNEVDEIVIAMDDWRRRFPLEELMMCRLSGIEVIDLIAFLERETRRVNVNVMNPSYIIFSESFGRTPLRMATSLTIDVFVSIILFILASPIMLLTAIAILLEDGRPVLYKQARVGLAGKHFMLLKFRSMEVDAEGAGSEQYAQKGDKRKTRVGTFIRDHRIDELPQILNVLLGDMSLVGPRPERPKLVEQYVQSIPFYRERHCVKPGITGWAQLCYPYGDSEKDALEKLQYDLFYVKNHNLIFDLMILLQTVEVVLLRMGSR